MALTGKWRRRLARVVISLAVTRGRDFDAVVTDPNLVREKPRKIAAEAEEKADL
jgi:hypothetical protein